MLVVQHKGWGWGQTAVGAVGCLQPVELMALPGPPEREEPGCCRSSQRQSQTFHPQSTTQETYLQILGHNKREIRHFVVTRHEILFLFLRLLVQVCHPVHKLYRKAMPILWFQHNYWREIHPKGKSVQEGSFCYILIFEDEEEMWAKNLIELELNRIFLSDF